MSARRTESQRQRRARGHGVGEADSDEVIDDGTTAAARRSRRSRRQLAAAAAAESPPAAERALGPGAPVDTSYARAAGDSSIRAKRRSVQMLTVVVVLFFVCWTPMYVVQTWSVFDYFDAVRHVSPTAMNYIHLLAFVSSCCNPITYCFMSAKFRQGFVDAFRCRRRRLGRPPGAVDVHAAPRHQEQSTATRSMLMMTTRERRVTTTSAVSEHDAIVSHQL